MRKRILKQVSLLVVMSVFLTFIAASIVMYGEFNTYMKQGVRDEVEFLRAAIEELGEEYIYWVDEETTASRITLVSAEGEVLFDSQVESSEMENHKNRPEFAQAEEKGYGETIRISETLSTQTFYYAVKLKSGNFLRVARTTNSMIKTMGSRLIIFGLIMM